VSGTRIRQWSVYFLQCNGPFWRRRVLAHFVHQNTCFAIQKGVKGIFCQKGILYYSYVENLDADPQFFQLVAGGLNGRR